MANGNPTTDQYLAAAAAAGAHKHVDCGGECAVDRAETEWINNLLATLPDVAPDIVGQVLLHTATRLPNLSVQALAFGVAPRRLADYLTDTLRGVGAALVNAGHTDGGGA